MHTGRKGRYTARISLLMKRSDLGRVRFEAVLRSVHRFVRLVRAVARLALDKQRGLVAVGGCCGLPHQDI